MFDNMIYHVSIDILIQDDVPHSLTLHTNRMKRKPFSQCGARPRRLKRLLFCILRTQALGEYDMDLVFF